MASKNGDAREDAMVQMATRIPKSLHRAVRVHCVTTGQTVMAFVIDACREKLRRGVTKRS